MQQLRFARKLFPVLMFPNKTFIKISPGVFVALCTLLFVFPVEWIISWMIAAAIHELSHYIALRICAVRIYSVYIKLYGARITTEPTSTWKECIAAIAGPASGTVLILAARNFPQIALCAFLQTCLNLIPIKEFDGGRIINCCLRLIFHQSFADRASTTLEYISLFAIFSIGLYISLRNKSMILLPMVAAILILRRLKAKTPCKRSKQIVQCTQSNIRGTRHE